MRTCKALRSASLYTATDVSPRSRQARITRSARVYKGSTVLVDPRSGQEWPTLAPRSSIVSSGASLALPIGGAQPSLDGSSSLDGSVFCYNNFGTPRFAVVGITVQNQDGTTSPLIFQTRDAGNPSSARPSVWQIDNPNYFTDCGNADFDNNFIVNGNVVVRP